jgi:glutaredoxin-like protein NrdH
LRPEDDGPAAPVTVTVYSTPDCVQCRLTYLALEKAGIAYRVVDLERDPRARDHVTRELGHATAPVVVVDQDPDVHWSGFRRDRIAALADPWRGPAV